MRTKMSFSRSMYLRETVEDYSATELCALIKSIETNREARVVALNGTREMLEAILNEPQLNYYIRSNFKSVIDAVEMGRCKFKKEQAPARATVVVTDHHEGVRVAILGTEMSVVVPSDYVTKYDVAENSIDGIAFYADRFDFTYTFPVAIQCYHPLVKMLRSASQHLECIEAFRSQEAAGPVENALRLFA